MADGRISIDVGFDDKDAQKELVKLSKEIAKTQAQIAKTSTSHNGIAESLREAQKEAIAAYTEVERLEKALETSKARTSTSYRGSINAVEFAEEIENQKKLSAELDAQKAILAQKEKAAQAIETKDAAIVGKLKEQTAQLEQQRQQQADINLQLAQQSAEALPRVQEASAKAADSVDGVARKSVSVWSQMHDAAQNAINGINVGLKKSLKIMLRYGFGIRSTFILIRRLRTAIVSGVKEYAEQDAATKASIDGLKASIQSLKGTFVSGIAAPIFNAVAPALQKLVNWCATGVEAVSAFFAILGGKNTYKRAVVGVSSVASAVSDVGTAAKEVSRYMSGLDELKTWEDNRTAASSGAGASSGGSGGGVSWEDVPINEDGWAARAAKGILAVKDAVKEVYDFISEKVSSLWNGFDKKYNISEKLKGMIESAKRTLKSIFKDWKLFGGDKTLLELIWDELKDKWEPIDQWLGKAVDGGQTGNPVLKKEWTAPDGKTYRQYSDGSIEVKNANGQWTQTQAPATGDKTSGWMADLYNWLFGNNGKTVDITAKVTKVEDGIPKKKKMISGFASTVISWVEKLNEKKKIMDFQARLTTWKDALRTKVVDFLARLTTWRDALPGKILDFIARLKTWKDSLPEKVLDFRARLNTWTDALKDKSIGFRATLNNWVRSSQWINGGDAWNSIAMRAKFTSWTNALPSVPKIEAQAIIKNAVTSRAKGGAFFGGAWHDIPQYASGGTPHGSLFIAGEAGAELVGHIGGRTEVLNGSQIAASISAGVARAIAGARFRVEGFAGVTPDMIPSIARGTVVPPQLIEASASLDEIKAAISSLAARLGNDGGNRQYEFTAQINRRILFDEMIEEARMRRATSGENPFSLARV